MPVTDSHTEIIPPQSKTQARVNYLHDLEAWMNFAQRITKNPFVKEFLIARDGKQCSWCGKYLYNNAVVHHVSYDHVCSYNKCKEIATPIPGKPNKMRIVPDCENCKRDNGERFMTCMSKLALVHSGCNWKIATQTRVIASES